MKRLIRWLRHDRSILRGAVVLGSGAALGQLVLVLSTPAISRLYTPAELGLLALYLSFVNVAVTIAPLGYHRAIPTTSNTQEAARLAAGIILVQPAMCCLLAVAQWVLMTRGILGFGDLPRFTIALAGFSIIANTLLFTLRFWFIREESYPIISRVSVYQNLGRAGLQVGLGLFGLGLGGLIAGDFTGRLLGLTGMLRGAWRPLVAAAFPARPTEFVAVFRTYHRFLFPQLPSIVMNTVARMLPVPLIFHYHGADAAGLYAIIDRVLQVPVALVSKNFGDALHGRIGRYWREDPGQIMHVFLRSSGGLLLAGLLPVALVMIWGRPVTTFILGAEWALAGDMARLIAPWALATLVVSTASRVVYVFQAFYTELWYNVASLVCVVGVFWYGDRHDWSLLHTVDWLARLGVLAYLFYFGLLLIIVRRGVRQSLATLSRRSAPPPGAA